jgi:3-deoxy-7-phosphoheptulonate synthase
LIDCSHGNSGKDANRQPDVMRNIVQQRESGTRSIVGAMLESNLLGGNQPFPQPREQLEYGRSITDECLDWRATEKLLLEIAEKFGE